ncbi:DUF3987 domain-containing protein [Bartonella pachyuromydis]|uniref:Phage related protein n=1 Tax=Bartonella pachyuromydis TaxID=931097 RepID=A0ABP8VEL4_9HYPH
MIVEKLGELLKENSRDFLMVRDEFLSFLANIERKEYQTDLVFYFETFNGDDQFTYDRIRRGTIYISHATLSIIGGIHPSRILTFIRNVLYGKSNDGFLQRFQM